MAWIFVIGDLNLRLNDLHLSVISKCRFCHFNFCFPSEIMKIDECSVVAARSLANFLRLEAQSGIKWQISSVGGCYEQKSKQGGKLDKSVMYIFVLRSRSTSN